MFRHLVLLSNTLHVRWRFYFRFLIRRIIQQRHVRKFLRFPYDQLVFQHAFQHRIPLIQASGFFKQIEAFKLVTKFEKLRPSLEPSHAFFVALKEAKKLSKDTIVIVNSCGDAYKDRGILEKRLGKKYVKSN